MEFNNQYLTYNEYKSLGGTLEETPFNILEAEGRLNIDNYTYGRLKNLSSQVNEVKLCVNALINILQSYAESNSRDKGIASEHTDGYSITYAGITIQLTEAQRNEVKNIINTYLAECKLEDGTPYLYVGV